MPVGADEITPLVHDGVIFIESANTIQALDGATGDLLWQYVRPLAGAAAERERLGDERPRDLSGQTLRSHRRRRT